MERIRKLEQSKVITGYAAIIDARQVGLDITAFIGVSINYPTRIDAFKEWVVGEPRVLECHHVTGGYTLLLKVKCRNTDGLESLISVIRSRLAADRTETLVVLSTSAERVQIPIDTERSPVSEAKPRRRRPPAR
jgi:Lrp/AsnC family leucine-responsive transcriptional regulator